MEVDVAAITRGALGVIADAHADGGALVRGVTAPVGFSTNAAWSVYGNSTKAVDGDWSSLREVANRGSVDIGIMN